MTRVRTAKQPAAVSRPHDAAERQADRAADAVARGGSVTGWSFGAVAPTAAVHRQESGGGGDGEQLKKAAGKAGEAALETEAGKRLIEAVKADPLVRKTTDFLGTTTGKVVAGGRGGRRRRSIGRSEAAVAVPSARGPVGRRRPRPVGEGHGGGSAARPDLRRGVAHLPGTGPEERQGSRAQRCHRRRDGAAARRQRDVQAAVGEGAAGRGRAGSRCGVPRRRGPAVARCHPDPTAARHRPEDRRGPSARAGAAAAGGDPGPARPRHHRRHRRRPGRLRRCRSRHRHRPRLGPGDAARRWKPGSATTSPMCASTTAAPRPPRPVGCRPPRSRSGRTSSSAPAGSTPAPRRAGTCWRTNWPMWCSSGMPARTAPTSTGAACSRPSASGSASSRARSATRNCAPTSTRSPRPARSAGPTTRTTRPGPSFGCGRRAPRGGTCWARRSRCSSTRCSTAPR